MMLSYFGSIIIFMLSSSSARHQQVRRNRDINPNNISTFLHVSIAQVIKLSVAFSHSRIGDFMPIQVSLELEIPICSAFSTEGQYPKKIRI